MFEFLTFVTYYMDLLFVFLLKTNLVQSLIYTYMDASGFTVVCCLKMCPKIVFLFIWRSVPPF